MMLHLRDDDVAGQNVQPAPVEKPADRTVITPVPEDKVVVNGIDLTLQSGCHVLAFNLMWQATLFYKDFESSEGYGVRSCPCYCHCWST